MIKHAIFTVLGISLVAMSIGCAKTEGGGTETTNPPGLTAPQSLKLTATQDTNTKELFPDETKGTSEKIDVWNLPGERKTAFIQFDLSQIPKGRTIKRALLNLWVYEIRDPGTIGFSAVIGSWTESQLTYRTAASLSLIPRFTQNVAEADEDKYIQIDVTEIVNLWLSGQLPNHGLAIEALGNSVVRAEFHSKDALTNPSFLQLIAD